MRPTLDHRAHPAGTGGPTRAALLAATALLVCGLAEFPAEADPAGDAVPVVTASPDKARPAESGGHSSAATIGPLAIGSKVRDAAGAEIGHVTLLTTDKAGRSVARVRQGEDVYTIPVADLYARDGAAFTTLTLAELRRGYVGGP